MKTRFADIEIGQEFETGIDADGYEPWYYKVSDTEAYQTTGNSQGLRHVMEPDDEFYLTGKSINVSQRVTEVERAAITLLHKAHIRHFGLRAWVESLGTDTNEMRHLDEFILESKIENLHGDEVSLAQTMRDEGFVTPDRKYDRDNSTWHAIFDLSPLKTGDYDYNGAQLDQDLDKAVLLLADSVRDYRVAGRPDGEQTHTIMGMGAPLMNVKTSLAAAIGEYHENVLGVYLYHYELDN